MYSTMRLGSTTEPRKKVAMPGRQYDTLFPVNTNPEPPASMRRIIAVSVGILIALAIIFD